MTQIQNKIFEHEINFDRHWKKAYLAENYTYKKKFNIHEGTFPKEFSLKNCIFEDVFIIEGGEFQGPVHFLNCHFQQGIIIKAGVFHRPIKLEYNEEANLPIKADTDLKIGCEAQGTSPTFHMPFEINGGGYTNININSGTFQNFALDGINPLNFSIHEGTFINGLSVKNCIFDNFFTFSGGTFQGLTHLENCHFPKGLIFRGGVFNDIIKLECKEEASQANQTYNYLEIGSIIQSKAPTFNKLFQITGGNYENIIIHSGSFQKLELDGIEHPINIKSGFKIKNTSFQEEVEIKQRQESKQSVSLSIDSGKFSNGINLVGGNYSSLHVYGGSFGGTLQITDGKFDEIYLNGRAAYTEVDISSEETKITKLKIEGKINHKLSVKDVKNIDEIILEKVNIAFLQGVYLEDLSVKTFKIDTLTNEGTFFLRSIKPHVELSRNQSHLEIKNCDLGKAFFSSVEFEDFNKVLLIKSNINAISTVDKFLPKNFLTSMDKQTNVEEYQKRAETLNQLYLAMAKQGNRTLELEYYAEFLKARHKSLTFQIFDKILGRSSKKKDKHRIDRKPFYALIPIWFSLSLHKCFSSFGRNWFQSFAVTMSLTAILYFSFIYTAKDVIKGNFIQYITTPTFFLTDIDKFKPSIIYFLASLADAIARLILAFGAYETITAFRRYGRKS